MNKLVNGVLIAVLLAATALGIGAVLLTANIADATSSPSNVLASANVQYSLYLSISPNTINFGDVNPNSINTYNTISITDTDINGNIEGNILIAGGNWNYGANSMLVSNTFWGASSSASGTALTNTLTDTGIWIEQPSITNPSQSNTIYFVKLTIPGGTPPGNYVQNITFQNKNITYGILSVPSTYNAIAYANVQPVCYIQLSTNSISFGNIAAGQNVPTNVLVTDEDPNGNVQATLYAEGTNWYWEGNTLSANTFGVTNTLWSPTSLSTYNGTPLTNTLITTNIIIPTPTQGTPTTSNNIYFGLAIPGGTPAGSYQQTITIENSC